MKQLWSVIRFEFNAFAKNKAFVGVTLLLMAIALIGPVVPAIIGRVGNIGGERTIAVVDNTGMFNQAILNEALAPTVVMVPDIAAANQMVIDGTHNYALEINHDNFYLGAMTMGMGVFNLENQIAGLLRTQHQIGALYDHGLTPELSAEILFFSPTRHLVTLGVGDGDGDSFVENIILVYVLSLVLMIFLQMGGGHLLTAVVREKSTKTMELLVTSCKPSIMLVGKVIGAGSALLLQLVGLAVAAIISLQITPLVAGDAEDVFTFSFSPVILAYMLLFFLLAFLTYAFVYAALASTCSRMEDATSMSQVPTLLLTGSFLAVMIGMNNPGAAWIPITSFVPFISPFMMFMRIAMGTAAGWEIALSIGIQIVTIGIISWLAAKIYRMGTLMYGAKPSFKTLLQAFK
ncbi:MAG: ABC transporter permease [Defluviitaleaceae bacterium]|nr:ABC transporter permease [Defluviitaleaceae bacterium]